MDIIDETSGNFRNISATFEAIKPGGHEKTWDIYLL